MHITALRVLAVTLFGAAASTSAQLPSTIGGSWRGTLQVPDRTEPLPIEVVLEVGGDGALRGSFAVPGDQSPIVGEYRSDQRTARFECDFDDPTTIRVELRLTDDGRLEGRAHKGEVTAPLSAARTDEPLRFHHDRGFPLPGPRPVTIERSTLDDARSAQLSALITSAVERTHAVGVSVAVILDNQIADVRSVGWQDVARGIAASARTMYRWASVAKPMTAIAALQLVESGRLDLDRDVRVHVPEFPDKSAVITPRQLLCHQGGIVHYSNGAVIATEREYDVEHPWADTILCLDRFRESPLIAEPGARYSYSSHGYMLLGAVVERAGERPFAAQVRERIAEPLGMRTLQPDHPWVAIADRAVGYRGLRIGLATKTEDLDVGWKLPAGGWVSTIDDLARFGTGILSGRLLGEAMIAAMCTSQVPGDGRDPGYGLGIGVGTFDGHRVLSHSGHQSKASSFLLLCPERRLGVCVMSNTENFTPARLARATLSRLLQWTR